MVFMKYVVDGLKLQGYGQHFGYMVVMDIMRLIYLIMVGILKHILVIYFIILSIGMIL